MAMYDARYLHRARELTRRYDVHLIADEIMTGFGRTGTMFACEQAAITPDLLCLSKGITGGYLPLSCVLATDAVFDAFYDDDVARGFLHSHSYTGNALACRAALAVLDIFRDDDVIVANRATASRWRNIAAPLVDSLARAQPAPAWNDHRIRCAERAARLRARGSPRGAAAANCCCDRSGRPSISCRPMSSPMPSSRCSSSARWRSSTNADALTPRRPVGGRGSRAGVIALALALSAPIAHGKLPREVGRAFLDAGIPLNHVGIVVQETTKARPLFEHDADATAQSGVGDEARHDVRSPRPARPRIPLEDRGLSRRSARRRRVARRPDSQRLRRSEDNRRAMAIVHRATAREWTRCRRRRPGARSQPFRARRPTTRRRSITTR